MYWIVGNTFVKDKQQVQQKKKAKARKLKFKNCGVVIQKVVVIKLWTCQSYDFYQTQKGKHLANLEKLMDGTNLKLQLTIG
jgi:hypothetical protein